MLESKMLEENGAEKINFLIDKMTQVKTISKPTLVRQQVLKNLSAFWEEKSRFSFLSPSHAVNFDCPFVFLPLGLVCVS